MNGFRLTFKCKCCGFQTSCDVAEGVASSYYMPQMKAWCREQADKIKKADHDFEVINSEKIFDANIQG